MKRFKIIAVFILTVMLFSSITVSALPNKFTVDVAYGEPATSGIGADWGTPFKATPDMMGWGGEVDNGVPMDYYLMWSEKGLFVAMDITMEYDVARNDGSGLDASHGGNCDRFQIAFNPGNEREPDESPVWFTFSALEDSTFHIVREDAQHGEVEDVTASCPGTAIVDGGRLQTSFMIPWEVININSAPFTAQAGFKMDIHVAICFAGDNASVVGSQKIEVADAPDDLTNAWVTGAMPITMNLLVKSEPELVADSEPASVDVVDDTAMGGGDENVHVEAAAPAPVAPATGDAGILFALIVFAASASVLVFKSRKNRI